MTQRYTFIGGQRFPLPEVEPLCPVVIEETPKRRGRKPRGKIEEAHSVPTDETPDDGGVDASPAADA